MKTTTQDNDVRMNNIRLGASGDAQQSMALLQFASTLQATQMQELPKNAGKNEGGGAPPAARPAFDVTACMAAMSGSAAGSAQGPARIGYGGDDGARAWADEQKKKKKEKKRKKKAKKEKRRAKKQKIMTELINEKNMTFDQASAAFAMIDSDSDSSSSSSS